MELLGLQTEVFRGAVVLTAPAGRSGGPRAILVWVYEAFANDCEYMTVQIYMHNAVFNESWVL